jgi:hypothetical protein
MKHIRQKFSVRHVIISPFIGPNLWWNHSIIFQQPREETLSRCTIEGLLEKSVDDLTGLATKGITEAFVFFLSS